MNCTSCGHDTGSDNHSVCILCEDIARERDDRRNIDRDERTSRD